MLTEQTWWWLSFASKERHLGIALVKASDMVTAVREAHRLGCNPGGEVAGWPIPANLGLGDPQPKWCARLLTREEADEMSREWMREPLVSTREHDVIDPEVAVAHEPDNEGS